MESMDKTLRGYSSAAMTLNRKSSENEDTGMGKKQKKVIKDIIKKKTGKDVFDPDPEIDEKDTIVKT